MLQAGQDRGDGEGGEAEPQEGTGGLRLTAALAGVGRAVGDDVTARVILRERLALMPGCLRVRGTYRVAAAVHAQPARGRNSGAEPEECVHSIKGDHNDRVECEFLLEGRGNEVEQRQHREDCHKHVIVDYAWVAAEGRRDHVTD